MVGYPKYLNTKADYEFVRANFPKEKWEGAFQSLLDTRCNWFNHGEINGEGISDDTHKIVVDEETGKKYQYVYEENPNCRMNQIGYTVKELNKILS